MKRWLLLLLAAVCAVAGASIAVVPQGDTAGVLAQPRVLPPTATATPTTPFLVPSTSEALPTPFSTTPASTSPTASAKKATTSPQPHKLAASPKSVRVTGNPTRIVIPSLRISEGMVAIPVLHGRQYCGNDDPRGCIFPPQTNVGWATNTPPPGQPGVAVIEGHDEWAGSHEKFWTLREIQNGAQIVVMYGSTKLTFVVTSHYAECKASDVPASDCKTRNTQADISVWNWDKHVSAPELVVITCNPQRGYYHDSTGNHAYDNEVVHARYVGASR